MVVRHSSACSRGGLEAAGPYDRHESAMVDLPGFGAEDATSDSRTLYDDTQLLDPPPRHGPRALPEPVAG